MAAVPVHGHEVCRRRDGKSGAVVHRSERWSWVIVTNLRGVAMRRGRDVFSAIARTPLIRRVVASSGGLSFLSSRPGASEDSPPRRKLHVLPHHLVEILRRGCRRAGEIIRRTSRTRTVSFTSIECLPPRRRQPALHPLLRGGRRPRRPRHANERRVDFRVSWWDEDRRRSALEVGVSTLRRVGPRLRGCERVIPTGK